MKNPHRAKNALLIVFTAVLFALSVLAAGCADLKTVSSLAAASSETLKITAVVDDLPESIIRQKEYVRDTATRQTLDESIKLYEKVRPDIRTVYKTASLYTNALGKLAAADLIAYKTEITALTEQVDLLRGTETLKPNELKAAIFLAKVFTDAYRQEELKKVITAANDDFQVVIATLAENDTRYLKELDREKTYLEEVFRKAYGEAAGGTDFLVLDAYQQRLAELRAKKDFAEKHRASLKAIGAAHAELYKNVNSITADEVRIIIMKYYQEIVDIYPALKK